VGKFPDAQAGIEISEAANPEVFSSFKRCCLKEQIAAAKMTESTTLVNFCADQIQQNFSQLSEWHSGSGQRQGLTLV